MITLMFLRTWFRWFFGTAAVLLLDWVLVTDWLWRVGLALAATAVFLFVSSVLYGDWKRARASGAGYRYTVFDDVTRD